MTAGSEPSTTGRASLQVAVIGSAGKMGRQVCQAVAAADDLHLVAAIDADDDRRILLDAEPDVVVEFTSPDSVMDNLEFCISHGLNVVVGTTGFTEARLDQVRGWLADQPGVGVLVAPNFGIGAVLLMRFAREAAPYFESVEVIEFHHPDKVDAPSGTAVHTAEVIAQARRDAGLGPVPDATEQALSGARGAEVEDVHVHAVRLRGLTASEEVIFGGPGETLTLRQDSHDRSSFMPGVLLGVRQVPHRPGLTIGIEPLLGLA